MSVENEVRLMGNLAADPEAARSSTSIAKLVLAVNTYDSASKTRVGKFYRMTAFGQKAEFALKYLKKGSAIAVVGELDINKWIDKAGQNRNDVVIKVVDIGFAPKSSGATAAPHTPDTGAVFADEDEPQGEINLF